MTDFDMTMANTWLPIRTMPYGVTCLVAIDGKYVTIGDNYIGLGVNWEPTDEEDDESVPTHWMPLPLPPIT